MLRSLLDELRSRRVRELRAYAAMASHPAEAAARLRHASELEMRAAAMDDANDWCDFHRR